MNSRILFYTIGTKIMPSTRARVYIYEDLMKKEGFSYKILHAINNFFCRTRIEGKRERLYIKVFFNLNVLFRLFLFIIHIPFYDYIVVQKILFPVIVIPIMRILFKNKVCYFDMDDIIYKYHQADNNTSIQEDRLELKFRRNISLYNKIVTTTEHLKGDIIRRNRLSEDFIKTLGDPIDTEYFKPLRKGVNELPVIGWIGTPSNTIYLLECLPDILELRDENYRFELFFVGVDEDLLYERFGNKVNAIIKRWTLDRERDYYDEIDIGLMPIPDNEWSRAKGGYKLMLYMSMEKICIASDVGINSEIIKDKKNGFLVSRYSWYDTIKFVLDNYDNLSDLRKEARNRILQNYSLEKKGEEFINLFK